MSDAFILVAYVEPEHRHFVEKAEIALEEYSQFLIEQINLDLLNRGCKLDPHPSEIKKAERLFREDPVRMYLVKHLANTKMMFERPRLIIKESSDK